MNWFTIEKEVDKIDEEHLHPDLNLRINRFTKWFISNVFGRALSYLVGWTGDAAKMLRCTSAGVLKVAITSSGFENNDTYSGTTTNAYGVDVVPDSPASKVEIWTFTNGITVQRKNSLGGYDDVIELEAGSYYQFEAVTYAMRCKSTVAGSHGTYQLVYWF